MLKEFGAELRVDQYLGAEENLGGNSRAVLRYLEVPGLNIKLFFSMQCLAILPPEVGELAITFEDRGECSWVFLGRAL